MKQEIEKLAEEQGITSQFLSDFPHDQRSVEYGFIAGYQKAMEAQKWVGVETIADMSNRFTQLLLDKGFELDRNQQSKINDLFVNFGLSEFNFTLPSPPNKEAT